MKISREDIHFINQHSNWSERGIDQHLKDDVYSDTQSWAKFIKWFCLSLGATFTTLGIIFFFAYNWADLHKFIKIGMIQGLMIAATLVAIVPSIDWKVRQIVLMVASAMVGVLFAVFGQVYQTGADSYDFFLGWTLFIMIWVLISNFAPLWLLFLTLINTTFILYTDQVGRYWREVDVISILFILNTIFVIIAILLKSQLKKAIPEWFIRIVALVAILCSTQVICVMIFDDISWLSWLVPVVALVSYGLGIGYGLKTKDRFYLAALPLSLITIVSALILRLVDEADYILTFFIISIFIIASVTFLIKTLLHLQKKWSNE